MSAQTVALPHTYYLYTGYQQEVKNVSSYPLTVTSGDGTTLITINAGATCTFRCMYGYIAFHVPSTDSTSTAQSFTGSQFDVFKDSNNNIWTLRQMCNTNTGYIVFTGKTEPPATTGYLKVATKLISPSNTSGAIYYDSYVKSPDDASGWDIELSYQHDVYGNLYANNLLYNFQSNDLSTNPYVLTGASGKFQQITGTVSSGKVQLPSGPQPGVEFNILNLNTNSISIYSDGSTNIGTLSTNVVAYCVCTATGSPPTWNVAYSNGSGSGGISSVTGDGTLTTTSTTSGAVTITIPTVTGTNKFWANDPSTSNQAPTFRTIASSDLPNPTTSAKGGVEAVNAVSHEWINSINTSGVPSLSQPDFTDISGSATLGQMPTGAANQFLAGNNSWKNAFPMDTWNNSGGDYIMLNTYNVIQYITGATGNINLFLPNSATCQQGQIFMIINDSFNEITVYDHFGSSNHITLFSNRVLLANNFSSSSFGFWYWSILPSNVSGNLPVLDANYGGTGQITYSPGDLLYANASFPSTSSQALQRLGIGLNGQVLTSNGTSPTWATLQNTFATVNMNGTPTNLVLTNTSATVQYITAYTSGNILLPDTTTCTVGQTFYIINSTSSSYIPLKNSSGGNIFGAGSVLPASTNLGVVCFSTSSANQWDKIGLTSVGGGSSVFGYIGAGGLGVNQWPAVNEIIVSGAVSSGTAPCDFVSNVSTSGIPLVSKGTGVKPQFDTVVVGGGGTGQTTFTAGCVLFGNGTSGLGTTLLGSSGQVLTSSGSSSGPTWTTPSSGTITSVTGDGTLTTTSTTSGAVTITIPTVTGTNKFWANDSSTSNQAPTFRAIASSDLPNPTTSAKGGVQAVNSVSHEWINSISTSGVPNLTQPAFSDISGAATLGQLPTGSANQFLAGNNSWKNAFPMDSYNNSSGDYTLLNTYNAVQYVTGSTAAINLFLPNSSTCQQGQLFFIINDSSNNIIVYDHVGSSNHITLFPSRILLANNFSSASNGFWYWSILPSNNSGNFPVLDANYGGTGRITYNPGDLLYAANTFPSTSAQALSNLAIGLNGYVLTSNGSAPQWSPSSTVGGVTSVTGDGVLTTVSSTTGNVTITIPTVTGANKFWANTTSGSTPGFRAIANADLPTPTTSALGGVEAVNAVTSNWINSISTSGVPSLSQPSISDISGLTFNPGYQNVHNISVPLSASSPSMVLMNGTGSLTLPSSSSSPLGLCFFVQNTTGAGTAIFNFGTGTCFNLAAYQKIMVANISQSGTDNFTLFMENVPQASAGSLIVAQGVNGVLPSSSPSFSSVGLGSTGGVLYNNGTNPTYTAGGSVNQTLISNGTSPIWQNAGFGGFTLTNSLSANLTLTATSSEFQLLTGTYSSGNIVFPASNVSPCFTGQRFTICNLSSSAIPIQSSAAVSFGSIPEFCTSTFVCRGTSTASLWVLIGTQFCGGTSTYTYPNNIATGGLGFSTWPAVSSVLLSGTSTTSGIATAQTVTNNSASGIPLISAGTSSPPTFGTALVPGGGTGQTTFTANGVLYGNGTSGLGVTAAGAASTYLTANGGAPSFTSYAGFSSTILIAGSTTNPTLTGTSSSAYFSQMGNLFLMSATFSWTGVSSTGTGNLEIEVGGTLNTSGNSTTTLPLTLGGVAYVYYGRVTSASGGNTFITVFTAATGAAVSCSSFFTTNTSGTINISGTLFVA